MHLRRSLHHRLYVLFCLFADHDGHKREQTSCRVFGTELQTNRNTEARICCYSYLWAACGVAALCHILDYRITFWYGCPITLFCLVLSIASYTKIFPRSQSASRSDAKSCPKTAEPKKTYWISRSTERQCTVPCGITACTTHSTTNIVIEEIMSGLVLFNPFLNQFHYCWRWLR